MMKTLIAAAAATAIGSQALAMDHIYIDHTVPIAEEQLECLSKNIYFEGRNQSAVGQQAIAMVTLNRVFDDRFPNDICDVVYDGYRPGKRGGCAFSWYCDGKSDRIKDANAYYDSMMNALTALDMYADGYDFTQGATHYHAKTIRPYWASSKELIGQIDDHIFYRWN